MLIQKTHQTISALSRVVPDAFLFVIDTTDRTFLFKSKNKLTYQEMIVQFDEDFGINKTVDEKGHHFDNYNSKFLGFKNIGTNTYLGFCLDHLGVEEQVMNQAQQLVIE